MLFSFIDWVILIIYNIFCNYKTTISTIYLIAIYLSANTEGVGELSSIAILIPIVMIVFIVLLAAGSREKLDNGGESMIKNVYVYLVLFATLMMTIGGSVAAFMAVADIYAPTPYHQSFEEYKQWGGSGYEKAPGVEAEKLSEEELKANYEKMIKSNKENTVARAKNSLIKSFGWIVIPLPIFIYFQRRLNSKKQPTV